MMTAGTTLRLSTPYATSKSITESLVPAPKTCLISEQNHLTLVDTSRLYQTIYLNNQIHRLTPRNNNVAMSS